MTLGAYFDSVLAASKRGSAWAWEALFRDLAGPIAGFARARNAPDPDDILQETFLAAARDIHRFSGDESDFRAWIFTIAHRRVADAFRKAGREVPRADRESALAEAEQRWQGDVEHEALSNMSLFEVSALVRSLSASQRDVLLLRVVGDLSVAETARILDKSEANVRALQSRALKALRDELGEGS